jgi:large subunit ribosomal protein L18
MIDRAKTRRLERQRRAERVRKRVAGTPQRPRLCVHRTLTNIYTQIVDDSTGTTLVYVSGSTKAVRDRVPADKKSKSVLAKIVGEITAEKAKEKGIAKVVFDRKGYLYHGRVKALADGARSKGLSF